MFNIIKLRGEAPDERERWREFASLGEADPHSHPGYVDLYLGPGERSRALVLVDRDSSWLLPYIERPVPSVGDRLSVDASSAYGFGGPFRVAGAGDAIGILEQACRWFANEGLVSVFLRLSSGLFSQPESIDLPPWIRPTGEIVVADMVAESGVRWTAYDHKVRKNVKKALRNDCSITFGSDSEHWTAFGEIYTATMDRRAALERYRFDESFFRAIARELSGAYTIALTRDVEARPVSAELILLGSETAYSFLGGTHASAFHMAPNDLLKHEVMERCHAQGIRRYVLGGGYESGDGIFRYKRAFAPQGVETFYTVQFIGDHDMYESLIARGQNDPTVNFFPRYRS